MSSLLKTGLKILGLGLLGFLAFAWMGMGPCATGLDVLSLLLGIAGTGIGSVMCLISLPVLLVRRHKARDAATSLSLFDQHPHRS
jgi:hypothetical protein